MIGQERLRKTVDRSVASGFPRFSIISGPKNSGKKMIAHEIAKKLNAHLIECPIKVDDIRNIINLSYKQSEPTVYLIPDADKMSIAAKNALLKVTEEPPRQAYFIMTVLDTQNTLATLRSRGTIFPLDPYTPEQLEDYILSRPEGWVREEINIAKQICTSPGDIQLLAEYNISEFYTYANTVVANIGTVNGANAFKIGLKLNYKEDGEGWDISLFFKTIMHLYLEKIREEGIRAYKDCIRVTSKYLSQMTLTGINKAATVDMWILEMRGVLCREE